MTITVMKHYCNICNQGFTRSNTLKEHYNTPKHLTNQAIYDGQLQAVHEVEKEEWDKQRASLLRDNREINEQLNDLTNITMRQSKQIQQLEGQLFVYSASNQNDYQYLYNRTCKELNEVIERITKERDQLLQERHQEEREKIKEIFENYQTKAHKWEGEQKEYERKIKIMQINFRNEMQTLLALNAEYLDRLNE